MLFQVAVIQYAVDASFEFYLNSYKTKASIVTASSRINQKSGLSTNTFQAIDFARSVFSSHITGWHYVKDGLTES